MRDEAELTMFTRIRPYSRVSNFFLDYSARQNLQLDSRKVRLLSDGVASYFSSDSSSSDTRDRDVSTPIFSDSVREKLSRANSLSPDVIEAMVSGAIAYKDRKTIDLLLEQAFVNGQKSSRSVEKLMVYFLESKKINTASNILQKCDSSSVVISQHTCQNILAYAVNHCKWNISLQTIQYMINQDYDFDENHVFFTVGGLMSKPEDVEKVLDLLKLIIMKRRTDLASLFSYTKVAKFATTTSPHLVRNTNSDGRDVLPTDTLSFRQALTGAMKASMQALDTDGWFSFSVVKMLVSIGIASRHSDVVVR
jgi:hypothetical protein